MQSTGRLPAAGERHIDAVSRERPLDRAALERGAPCLDSRLQALLRFVDARAGCGPLGGCQPAECLQLLGERALLAEPADACVIERSQVAACGNLGERLLGESGQVGQEWPSVS